MASEQWSAWFRLTVVSGAKVIVKKYVSGINSSDCIGDLITQHLDDYSGRTIASFQCSIRDDSQATLDRADFVSVKSCTPLFVLKDFGAKYVKVSLRDADIQPSTDQKSAFDVLMGMGDGTIRCPLKNPLDEQPDQAKQQIDHIDVIPDRQPQKQPEDDWSSSIEDSPVNYDNDVLWTPTHQRGYKLSQNHQKPKGRKALNPKMSRRVVKSPYEGKKKCVNGFIMFCRINRKLYIKEHPGMPSTRATCALATLWHQMSTEEKNPYCVKARAFSQVNNRNVHIDNNTAVVDIEIVPQSLPMVHTDSVYGTDKRTLDASDHIKMNMVSGFHKRAMTQMENDGLRKSQKSRNPKRQKLVHEAREKWMENPRANPHREKNAFLDKDMFIW